MKRDKIGVLIAGALFFLADVLLAATRTWINAGGDDNWSTTGNWSGGTVPGAADIAYFDSTGVGETNVVDQNWVVQGLHYNNSVDPQYHVTDLAGNTLTISNGDLRVGITTNHSLARITNGTLNLSAPGGKANVYVGFKTNNPTVFYTNNILISSCTIIATNMGTVYVGYAPVAAEGFGSICGEWDLHGSTCVLDRIKADNLYVASGAGYLFASPEFGTLRLPPSLKELEIPGDFMVGQGQFHRRGKGTVDLGGNAALQQLTVKGKFLLGSDQAEYGRIGHFIGGGAFVDTLPTGLVVTVGQSGSPVSMVLGYTESENVTSAVVLANGTFTAHLTELRVGQLGSGATGWNGRGLLDLHTSTVQIGNEANKVKVPTLWIGKGADGYQSPYGTVRLPATVTEFVAGDLQIGVGGYQSPRFAQGTLDFSSNSVLNRFAVTNNLVMGAEGASFARIGYEGAAGFVTNFPNGMSLELGLTNRAIPVTIGQFSIYGTAPTAALTHTNGTFSGYISDLKVGVTYTGNNGANGRLDLRTATLTNLTIASNAFIGAWSASDNAGAKGYVALPSGSASVSNLFLGDVGSGSSGVLELFGTRLTSRGNVDIGPTGRLTNHVQGVSCGLDVSNTTVNALSISNGAAMHLVFESAAVEPFDPYWGLRMTGDRTNLLVSLTNSPARLTWDISALPAAAQTHFGIFYIADDDYSFVGVNPGLPGTVIFLR